MSDTVAWILVIVAVVVVVAIVVLLVLRTRGRERRAREEAEIAEARAMEARQGLAQTEAQQEDTLREADRLDPSVDHRGESYQPGDATPPPAAPPRQQ
jgi:flagellar biosynthesis/type III secretory pathway M-ring protein FliF/YscJ